MLMSILQNVALILTLKIDGLTSCLPLTSNYIYQWRVF